MEPDATVASNSAHGVPLPASSASIGAGIPPSLIPTVTDAAVV